MKKLCLILITLLSVTAAETGNIDMPLVKSSSLDNGVRLFHIDDELPRTVFYVSTGYGRLYENKDRAGMAELLARTLSIGGTKKYPGNKMYSALEAVGGEINFIPGWENVVIEIKVLTRHIDLAYDIISDIMLTPEFNETSLVSAKELVLEKIKRGRDNPADMAFEKLRELIFCGSGYGNVPSEKTIDSVSLSELEALWKEYFKGGNVSVAVSSSISADEFFKSAEKYFGSIGKGERIYYSTDGDCVQKSLLENKGKIFLIPMDLEQATVVMGTSAPNMSYEGNYSLDVMNYILGGGSFNSRLTNEIRVKRGLAYSVFSLVRSRYSTGVFMSFVQTRIENVPLVFERMRENIEEMALEAVPEQELLWAKDSIIKSYIFKFEKISDILSNYLDIDYNRLDKNYYRDYSQRINSVKSEDILKEASQLFNRGLITVVVGDIKIAEKLKSYGEVIILENSGN